MPKPHSFSSVPKHWSLAHYSEAYLYVATSYAIAVAAEADVSQTLEG